MGTWLKNQIKSFCTGVLDGFLDFFGIHSPSSVFRDQVGKYMAQGLGVGFTDEMSAVQRRINSSMAELTASVEETSGAGKTVRIAGQAAGNTAGASDLAAAVREALNGAAVYMDGRKVGRLVTAQQRMNERALGGTLTPV